MVDPTLTRARAGDEDAFRELTAPYRHELQVHCYRMLGSLQDAEDALQETLVSAWRGLDGFQQRASLRAWLYRIATNRCLNLRREGARRPSPALPFAPPPPTRLTELSWLEPYPEDLLQGIPDTGPGPEARYETREAIGLAFIVALQRLSPRQRSVLVLRDVLGFRAGEVADMLDTSEATVNSALQRARGALEDRLPPVQERVAPGSPRERELADNFADAFEHGDMERVVELLTEDAWITMPPEPFEYQGREVISDFLAHAVVRRRAGGRTRLVPTRANGQPAFGHYVEQEDARTLRGTGVLVLTLRRDGIAEVARFGGVELLQRFGLPPTLPG